MRTQTDDWALTHAARATPSTALKNCLFPALFIPGAFQKLPPQKVPVPKIPRTESLPECSHALG